MSQFPYPISSSTLEWTQRKTGVFWRNRIGYLAQRTSCRRKTINQLSKDRQIISIDLHSCEVHPSALEALRGTSLNAIGFTKSKLVVSPDDSKSKEESGSREVYELLINECDSRLADQVLDRIGFAKRITINMPSSYPVMLEAKQKDVEKIVIKGCALKVDRSLIEASAVSEISLTGTKLTALRSIRVVSVRASPKMHR